jgi:hypothetical protein
MPRKLSFTVSALVALASVALVVYSAGVFPRHSKSPNGQAHSGRDVPRGYQALAARDEVGRPASPIPPAFARALHLDVSAAQLAGSYATPSGESRVYLVPSAADGLCVIELSPVSSGGGCGIDLTAGPPITWIEAYEGGPDPATIYDRHLIGAADVGVAQIDVTDSSGVHVVHPTKSHVFRYDFPRSEGSAVAVVKSLTATNARGDVVGTVQAPSSKP